MNSGLVSIAVLLALFEGCTRHPNQGTVQANHEPAPVASLRPAGSVPPEFTQVASEPQTLDRSSFVRPSPFSVQPASEVQNSALPQLDQAGPTSSVAARPTRPKTAGRPEADRKPLKPFVPNLADTSRDRVALLPQPPALPAITQTPASNLNLGRKTCCVGTATFEPVRPALLRRMFGKVPGIRRIHQKPADVEGYVAPRPAREIRLVLPPETNAVLIQGTMDLKATVDESGRVTRVELLSPKNDELVRLASYAAGSWPFVPAKLNEKAVPSEVTLHFTFNGN
jgi:TonB family protein